MARKQSYYFPVNVDYGIMIHDQCVLFNDYNDCSNQNLKMLEFQLKNEIGRASCRERV